MATSSRWIPLESNPEVRVSVQRLRSVASDSASITPGLELRMFDLRYIYIPTQYSPYDKVGQCSRLGIIPGSV
jgi:hypothetical protein